MDNFAPPFPNYSKRLDEVLSLNKKELLRAFSIGAFGYPLLELAWRGRTHLSMAVAGGISFAGLYRIHNRKTPLFLRCFQGALWITGVEFFTGLLINKVLHQEVWDYSGQKYHVLGQICLNYTCLWFALSALVSPLCKRLRVYNTQ